MFLVVGLGNPGSQYEATRHNAGFMVVEEVARRAGASFGRQKKFSGRFVRATVAGHDAALLLPQTYMNDSGRSVGPAAHFFHLPAERVVVVHDELDLPYGTVRVKQGGGLAGHNGLKSIKQHLGTDAFLRVRFGVGKPREARGTVVGHVLGGFDAAERAALPGLVDTAADAVEAILAEGVAAAMNRFNQKAAEPPLGS